MNKLLILNECFIQLFCDHLKRRKVFNQFGRRVASEWGSWDRYMESCGKSSADEWVVGAFRYSDTPEGAEYWMREASLWNEYLLEHNYSKIWHEMM